MNTPGRKIAVALLDDHPVVTFGVAARLQEEPDIAVVGRFESAAGLIAALNECRTRIDVLVTDYQLRPDDIDGISLIRLLKTKIPSAKLLVSSAFHNASTVNLALNAGAHGFVGKEEPLAELVAAIRNVARGNRRVCGLLDVPPATRRLVDAPETTASDPQAASVRALLTRREFEVLRCFATGMTISAIAAKFHRSLKTISAQKQSAYKKLGVRSDFELYAIANQFD